MNKKLIAMFFLMAPIALFAQKFGHVSYAEIFQMMPEAKTMQTELESLASAHEKEFQMLQEEFARKNEAYEKEKATLPANILQRREQELQELYNRMAQYAQQAEMELAQSKQEKENAIIEKIAKAVKEVGAAGGYVYIFEKNSIPFVSETLSTDVTAAVKAKLGIK